MDDDDAYLRNSMAHGEIEQDRRLILKKLQQRRRGGAAASAMSQDPDFSDEEEEYPQDDDFDLELLRDVQEAHQQDEEMIGGRAEDGQEAMNQAMSNYPTQWWAMRKQWQKRRGQWQKRRGTVMGLRGAAPRRDPDEPRREAVDSSHRSGSPGGDVDASSRSGGLSWTDQDGRVVGHPVMLEDPASVGYEGDAFTQQNVLSKKRTASVVIVSRDIFIKRVMQQTMYIVASLFVVLLFVFFLQQRKLSHYAMVQSPMRMASYFQASDVAGMGHSEQAMTLDDLGLARLNAAAPDASPAEFGNIEVDPGDPLANAELAHDPFVGNRRPAAGADRPPRQGDERLALLQRFVVARGVTPASALHLPNSPQSQALRWMAHEDVVRYATDDEHWMRKTAQRYALATLYYATNGFEWADALLFLSSSDECDWHREREGFFSGAGHCEGGYITALALWSNNLRGALPPELGALTSLRTLAVFDNQLLLPPPKSLVQVTSLQRLYIQENNFTSNVDYLCKIMANKEFQADCGKKGGVACSCCSACGYDERNDRGKMLGNF